MNGYYREQLATSSAAPIASLTTAFRSEGAGETKLHRGEVTP